MNETRYVSNNKKLNNIKNKKSRKDKDYSVPFIKIIIILCLLSLLFTVYKQEQEISSLKMMYEDVEYEYAQRQEKLKKLQKELKMVDSLEFIEKQAREKLKMVKPNEKVYVDTNKNNKEKLN